MTDNQIIDEIILWALEVHYPAPAPIDGWLVKNYGCDERRKWVIINKIEAFGFARLYNRTTGSDMTLTAHGIQAAENGSPIDYHMKEVAKKNEPKIQGNNIIYNSGSISGSEINQGSNRREGFPIPQINSDTPAQKPKQKSLMWDIVPDWAKIIGGLGAISGAINVIIEWNKK